VNVAARATVTGRLAQMRSLLPRGGGLPLAEWRRRHAGIVLLLWLNVLAVPLIGIAGGHLSTVHSLESGAGLAVLAALAALSRMPRQLRTAAASLGLLSAAAMQIHASGGLVVMHFYFFVLIIVLTLYEDWMPFLLALVFVLIHHGVYGTIEPKAVFDRPAEWRDPWLWAAIHAAYVAAAGGAALVAWRLNEDVRGKMRDAHAQLEVASETDSLTGLANRRRLMADLEDLASSGRSGLLVILDLDGFKAYNDTFGHPAGDALLARLGGRLRQAVADSGRAYRLGGDEFCAILTVSADQRERMEAKCAAALVDSGEGFKITAAHGAVAIPSEAETREAALHAADMRMYSRKHGTRASSGAQSRDVLLQALAELRPELGEHIDAVTVLAKEVAERLGLAPHVVEQVALAAQLHDIGKIAIPAEILQKPASLDEREWSFMREHTVIGERIVGAAPALAEVARLVRASHERLDGSGYPDGLRGEEIPIGARIISVCDAFDAMTSKRAYRATMSPSAALAELHRCAGTHFDPDVVAAFEQTLHAPARAGEQPAAPADPAPASSESAAPGKGTSLPYSARSARL
jgi:diguanylate cyclase (GGDEF)-like protein